MKNEPADATHQATPDPFSNVKTAAANSHVSVIRPTVWTGSPVRRGATVTRCVTGYTPLAS